MLIRINILNRINILFVLIYMLFTFGTNAQSRFNKCIEVYDDSTLIRSSFGIGFVQINKNHNLALSICTNSNLIDTLGYYKSFVNLTKFDINGNTIDSNNIFFKGNFYSANFILKYDKGTNFIAGNIINYKLSKEKAYGYDLLLIKVDNNGDTLWSKKYSLGKGHEFLNKLIKSEDGNLLLFGTKCPVGTSPSRCDFYLLKVDTSGNIIFENNYFNSESSNEYAGGIITTNNKIFIYGAVDSVDYNLKPYIAMLDRDGILIKSKVFKNIDLPKDIFLSSKLILDVNNNMLLVGSNFCDSNLEVYGRVIRIDSSFNVLWQKNFDGLPNNLNSAIKFNNKYMIVGSRDINNDKSLAMISVFRENGNKVFERLYSMPKGAFSDGSSYDLSFINDSLVLVLGSAYFNTQPFTQKTWIFTIDTFGCLEPGCPILGIENVPFNLEPLKIYPNPTVDFIKIDHSVKINTYQIMDLQGAKLLQGNYLKEGIDVRKLPIGLYFIQVLLDDGTQSVVKFRKE